MLKVLLWLHVLMEIGAGLTFIFFPQFILTFQEGEQLSLNFFKSYGYAALAIGILGLVTLYYYDKEGGLAVGLFTLACFHSLIAIAQINSPLIPHMQLPPMLTHAALACLFWFYHWQKP